ncbi:hypothetical protein RAM80_30235 [Pseudomonas sp. App30]|uniref:hypothetical protein n=1 Tax=Pseudomonas sp. App30 TaxID=3068990 RepID=UPI003A8132A5
MKISTMIVLVVPLLAVSGLSRGDDTDNTSGAPNATVLTQTHDSKAAGNKHGDDFKGGRPTAQSGATKP